MSYLGRVEFSSSVDDDQDPDYVYYNASIINNRVNITNDIPNPQIRFQESRDVPLVKDASKYNFSIVRFTLDGPNKDLPLFIPAIRIGPVANPTSDVNLTVYSLTLECDVSYNIPTVGVRSNSFISTQPIIYSPETLDTNIAPVPLATSTQTGQDVSTKYYWIYTFSHFLKLVNATYAAALADIQTQFDAWWIAEGGTSPPTLETKAPYMVFNPTNKLFTIYADTYGFGGADRTSVADLSANENFTLYFNENLYGLFTNFENEYVNLSSERVNKIIIRNILYQNITTVSQTSTSYYKTIQDYPSVGSLWSPIESIVFTSALLPLVNEATGAPIRFGVGNDNMINTTASPFTPIVTDLAINTMSASDWRDFIYYVPSAEYRLASFGRSKFPINNIDIQIFWKNRLDGTLYPITMFNGSTCSIKIMLRRRGVFDFPHPEKVAIGSY
jgi:hypothetical protein